MLDDQKMLNSINLINSNTLNKEIQQNLIDMQKFK